MSSSRAGQVLGEKERVGVKKGRREAKTRARDANCDENKARARHKMKQVGCNFYELLGYNCWRRRISSLTVQASTQPSYP